MLLRLEPSDEYTHPLEEATNFNESMYFNVFDPNGRIGGFTRLGNRANEGYAEMTACLYLPDGRIGFMFGRPEISSNDTFDAGGMRFEVVEPFEELRVSYRGKVVVLDEPEQMANPRRAFTENPWVDSVVELEYRGLVTPFGGEPVNDDGSALTEDLSGGFARGHYEQHVGARGAISVGDEEWEVDGFGLRDHSWGPRFWQAPWWYRWLTINFDDDAGFVLSIITSREGKQRVGGVAFESGEYRHLDSCEIDTDWEGTDSYHREIRARATAGDRTYEIEGTVLNLIPLRNRRTSPEGEQLVTRISEGMTEWRWNGRTGYGLSEYLDQIVDGQPVGVAG
jgi:hypothetical protein